MALSVKHAFTSAKSDGLDTTKVQPSNWNAEHTLIAAIDKVLGTDSGSTTVKELACTAAGRAMLAALTENGSVPLGAGYHWFTNTLPVQDGTVEVAWANGQAISRSTYAGLFALWGTTYGVGDGSTTFNVPNACEVALIGRSTMGGVAARGLITHLSNTNVLGTLIGEGRHTLITAELAQHLHGNSLAGGNHTHANTLTDNGHVHDYGYMLSSLNVGSGGSQGYVSATGGIGYSVQSQVVTNTTGITINNVAQDAGISLTNANAGSNTPHNIVQPGLICNFVIRIK